MAKMPRTTTPADPDGDADDLGQTHIDKPTDEANRGAARSAGPRPARAPGMMEHHFAHGRPRSD